MNTDRSTAPAEENKHEPAASPAAQLTPMELQLEILKRLEAVEKKLTEQNLLMKDVLNFDEAVIYLEMSESHLYKLTSKRKIPHSKPDGKLIYFDRKELDKWRMRNPIKTQDQIEATAANYNVLRSRAA
jgi:excisionase family DNA binding protein